MGRGSSSRTLVQQRVPRRGHYRRFPPYERPSHDQIIVWKTMGSSDEPTLKFLDSSRSKLAAYADPRPTWFGDIPGL